MTIIPRSLDDVPGWLTPTDRLLFEWILRYQTEHEPPGDAVELGVFKGKSAIHTRRFLQTGERYTVCDLFDDAATEDEIRPDVRSYYRTLSQEEFEKNYLDFHPELPVVIRGLTSVILNHVEHDTCRFVHIDASHMYEHVRADTVAAKTMLRENGVVVFDDYRTEHTIGTAAAVWEALNTDELVPLAASSMKLYATWGDPSGLQAELFRRLAQRADHKADPHRITGGHEIIRVATVPKPKAAAAPAPATTAPIAAPASTTDRLLAAAKDRARPIVRAGRKWRSR